MAARIRSLQNGINAIDEASRDDLVVADVMTVSSLDAATTYAWTLVFVPEGSAATFSGVATAVSPGSFTVDLEGAYLVRLVVDAGLGTESTQYVRLRLLTAFESLKLVAAGERRDGSGVIPVDVDPEGWANEQNFNLQTLKAQIARIAPSGKVFYVDTNAGTSGHGQFPTIQDAIDAAVIAGATSADPWLIRLQDGVYVEDLTFAPGVYLASAGGHPGLTGPSSTFGPIVAGNHTVGIGAGETALVMGITMVGVLPGAGVNTITMTSGSVSFFDCTLVQAASPADANQGPAILINGGAISLFRCGCVFAGPPVAGRAVLESNGVDTTVFATDTSFNGPEGVRLGPDLLGTASRAQFTRCSISASDAAGVGVACSISDLVMDRGSVSAQSNAILIAGNGYAGAISVQLAFLHTLSLTACIVFDTTGVGGATSLDLGAVRYQGLSFPGGAITSLTSAVEAESLRYADTFATGAVDVQTVTDFLVSNHGNLFPLGGPGVPFAPLPAGVSAPLTQLDHLIPTDPNAGVGPVVVSLPAANSVKAGKEYVIIDFSPAGDGGPGGNGVDVAPAGADIVNNGAPGVTLVQVIPAAAAAGTFASVKVYSDGVSRWVVV